jgi:glyoxylase-like metal-dependent hydrolase (beta-lactamase superfamily II)
MAYAQHHLRSLHVFFRLLLVMLVCATASLSHAGAPQQKTQVPGYYRFMVGSFEVTALYDGYIDLDSALLKNTNPKEVQNLLARMFLKGPKVQTAVNAYLINTGEKLVLVDAGAAKGFGPTLGYIGDNLKAAGYDASKIDIVLITHLHGDHVNGLLAPDGKMAFPNADIWSAQPDNDFWLSLDVAAKAPEGFQPFFKMARDAAAPYQQAGKWKTFSSDQDIVSGIASVAARGHTPGHSAYQLRSGAQQLLIWGDLVHNHAVQFARPHVAIEFDIDKKQAVLARKALFARAAKEKLLVGGMHLPFPGVGHVRAEGKGYAWVPVEFGPIRE